MHLTNLFVILNVIACSESVILNHDTDDDSTNCTSTNPCLKKCCPEFYVFQNKACTYNETYKFSLDVFEATNNVTDAELVINVIHDKLSNCSGRRLKLGHSKKDLFFIQKNGSMFKPNDDLQWIVMEDFCLETFVIPSRQEFSALVCYGGEQIVVIEDAELYTKIGKCFNFAQLFVQNCTHYP